MRQYFVDVARAIGFLSRFPVPGRFFDGYDGSLRRTVRAFPIAGLLIALPAAALALMLGAQGSVPLLSAFLVLLATTLVTGALHEDGLGDAADGIGGGRDREHALTIMRDSRVGSYGVVALILSFGIRAAALSTLFSTASPFHAALIVLATASLARTAMVWHWMLLPPARKDGVAAGAGAPETDAAHMALVTGLVLALMLFGVAAGFKPAAGAILVAIFASWWFSRIVLAKIGGHTGDTIGATEQISEIAGLTALAVLL
jgi:adenosylcobinamide-GDP ribazoletransferase